MASRTLSRISRRIVPGGSRLSISATPAWSNPIHCLAPTSGRCSPLGLEGMPYNVSKPLQQPFIFNSTLQRFGISCSSSRQSAAEATQLPTGHSSGSSNKKALFSLPGFLTTVSSCNLHPAVNCRCSFSTGTSSSPVISDFDVQAAFKELMAWGWDEIPNCVIKDAKKALAKNTEDKAGQKVLSDVFRAAEASVEFSAILVNIRMALEERTGMTGENVAELPEELANAITVAYNRYISYVNSFSSEETYLRKKVEAELGTRLIHLKQRVSGLGSEWGEINVIGTSGLSGSYVEHRI